MSSIMTDFRAPAVARTTAMRAADGVTARYIHSLLRASAELAAGGAAEPKPRRLAPLAYECGSSRRNGVATRRRLALRRAALPA